VRLLRRLPVAVGPLMGRRQVLPTLTDWERGWDDGFSAGCGVALVAIVAGILLAALVGWLWCLTGPR